jgi:hypothetical protein
MELWHLKQQIILSLNPCDSQTKLNLYLERMVSLAYTFLFNGNRLRQSYTEVEFDKSNVTNLTNQCVVQIFFWSVLCISPFHFVLWIPGLYQWVGIQINFFEIYNFFVWPGKKTCFF